MYKVLSCILIGSYSYLIYKSLKYNCQLDELDKIFGEYID